MSMPQQIGGYRILSELGRGGLTIVYRARDPGTGREFALKVVPRDYVQGPSYLARFERDAKAIAALNHPAIVPVYAFGEESSQFFLTMRYMPGGALPDRIARGPLPLADVSRIVERVASALAHAHEREVLHRNLRSGSILYDEEDEPYLSDFGIVTLPEVSSAVPMGVVMNALAYMPPEQIRREALDERADVYALGVILFEALTGQRPYRANNPQALAAQHLGKPVPSIRETLSGYRIGSPDVHAGRPGPPLPPGVEDVVARAMAKSPEERFESASELAAAWALALAGEPVAETPSPAEETLVLRPAKEPVDEVPAATEETDAARPAEVGSAPPPPGRLPQTAQLPPLETYLATPPPRQPTPPSRSAQDRRRGGGNSLFTVLILLLIGVVVALGGFLMANAGLIQVPGGGSSGALSLPQTHNAGALGMTVSLPEGWVVEDAAAFGVFSPEMTMTAAAPDRAALDALHTAIEDGTFSLEGPIFLAMVRSLQGLPEDAIQARPLMEEFKRETPITGFQAGPTRSRRIDGERAAWANFTGTDPETGDAIEGRMVTVVWSGNAGFLLGAAPADEWENYAPTFEAIVSAVDLLEVTAVVGGQVVSFGIEVPVDSQGEFTAGDGFETSAVWGISVNESGQSWVLEDGPQADNWKFQGSAGWPVTITVRTQEQGFDPYLKLIGPDGRILGSNDDDGGGQWGHDAQRSITLPETGEYVARVTAYDEVGGAYSISVTSP